MGAEPVHAGHSTHSIAASDQRVPADLLARADKILFVAHLALGDFTYLQNFFQAFARRYPHLQVHLWVDEVRRTDDSSQWQSLAKYSLYDWVQACPFFSHVYTRTWSPQTLEESVRQAQQQAYPLVVSLATLRPAMYAELARRLSPQGFVAGLRGATGLLGFARRRAYRQLNASLPWDESTSHGGHITDVYAGWFRQFFGLDLPPAARLPFVEIPSTWQEDAERQLRDWGLQDRKLVFINTFAKTKKRCWPTESAAQLVLAMRARAQWREAGFILNAMPRDIAAVKHVMQAHGLTDVQVFSATENFFQLPAMLARCELIISVETAVMHLANAVHVPVIALMRQKNPEWVPIDREHSTVITTRRRRDWVKEIAVAHVMKEIA